MVISGENDVGDSEYVPNNGISPEVERFRAVFEKCARQEGGLWLSECNYGAHHARCKVQRVLVYHLTLLLIQIILLKLVLSILKKCFNEAGKDVHLALQVYNFGSGFIGYVKEHGGKYTKKLALEFSCLQAIKRAGKVMVTQFMSIMLCATLKIKM